MNIVIFDTETTSLEKPFCYNVGYVICDHNGKQLLKREFVIEQIWHNLPLFSTAYYNEKRPIYVGRMRAKKVIMDKFGYVCMTMAKDFKQFEVEKAFAYNSAFDEKVFNFNCDWFKCQNPFDNIEIADIRGYVHSFIVDDEFKDFCEQHEYFTESGNYSTTAETLFRYVSGENDFDEEHTALADSEIEGAILFECVERGAKLDKNYPVLRSVARVCEKELHIKTTEQTDYYFKYNSIRMNKDKTEIILK